MNYRKGFTLIELLVVISIISLLSSVVFSSLGSARLRAKNIASIQQLKQIQTALEIYYTNHGQYPPSQSSPGWGPSLGMWTVECSVNPSISNPSGFLIPEIVADGLYSGVKNPSLDCSGGAYDGLTYGSNGQDYKLVAYKNQPFDNINESFIDPATDYGSTGLITDHCILNGPGYEFYGIWSSGATCWVQRYQCDIKDYCLSPDGVFYN